MSPSVIEQHTVGACVRITVPGNVRGKQRPRASRRGRGVRLYTPEETVAAEATIAAAARAAMVGRPLLDGPLEMAIEFVLTVPESWTKRKRAMALSGLVVPTVKPDADNAAKLVADALNKIVYPDDAAIARMALSKIYGETAETRVCVRQLTGAERALWDHLAALAGWFAEAA